MANALTAELNLNIKKFTAKLNRAERAAASFGKKGGKAAGKSMGKGIETGVASGMKRAASVITKTLTAIAAASAVLAARVIQRSMQEAGKFESAGMRFDILTGDSAKSKKVLDELRATALRTGITFDSMSGNVAKFMAFGFSPEKALELNKGILDVGGAVGMTTTDMKLLGVALSQVAAKGVGSMEELRQQIAEKGIPIFKALEEQLGVTGAVLNRMIQNGEVSSDVVLGLFTDVAKGKGPLKKFAGGADAMAKKFEGRVRRMGTHWKEFLMQFGKPIIESLGPIMDDILIIMGEMIKNADQWGKRVAATISKLENFTDPMAKMSESIDGFEKAWDAFSAYAWASFGNGLAKAFIVALASVGTMLLKIIHTIGNAALNLFSMNFVNTLNFAFDSVITRLEAGLMRVGASFVDKMAGMHPMMKAYMSLSGGSRAMRERADHLGRGADEMARNRDFYFGKTMDVFNNTQDDFNKAYEGQIQQLISNLNDPAQGLDLFGSKGAKENLNEVLSGLTAKKESIAGAALSAAGAATGGRSSSLGAAVAQGGPLMNSRVDQMNNAIMGRSAFSVIASEAMKAGQQREKTNAILTEIRDTVVNDGQPLGNPAALSAF